jgi:alkylhydroperoxidase family enzyme
MSVEQTPRANQPSGWARAPLCRVAQLRGCEWCVSEDHCSRCGVQAEPAVGRTQPKVSAAQS